jgi:drug/metabolite transporter (DMT)-like permease
VLVILAAFYAFAVAGALEGVHFTRNKWVGCMALSTFIAACSSLYDKYLLQSTRLDVPTVQAWFSIYLVPVVAPLYLWWKSRTRGSDVRFRWEWGVPAIAWLLLAADYLYFSALRADGALIAVISPLRRTAVVVSLTGGILLFGEHGFRRKALCVAGMLVGVVLLSW